VTAPVIKAALCLVMLCLTRDVRAQGHDAAMTGKSRQKKIHVWWDERHPGESLNSPLSRKLPLISVRGNRFVDPDGNVVLFRGLSISDPDKIESQGHWSRQLFELFNEPTLYFDQLGRMSWDEWKRTNEVAHGGLWREQGRVVVHSGWRGEQSIS